MHGGFFLGDGGLFTVMGLLGGGMGGGGGAAARVWFGVCRRMSGSSCNRPPSYPLYAAIMPT